MEDFPGGPVAKDSALPVQGAQGFNPWIPGWGTSMPHGMPPPQKKDTIALPWGR